MSKFVQDLKLNIKSKAWWATVIGATVLILQCFGIDLTKYIGSDWKNTLDIACSLLTALGVHMNLSDNQE